MALKDALQKLADGLEDLASLEVRTYSGNITTLIDSDKDTTKFKELVKKGLTGGDFRLKLYTRLDADGDSDHFFDAGGIDEIMLNSHIEAFNMGHEIRKAYLELFKDVADDILVKAPKK